MGAVAPVAVVGAALVVLVGFIKRIATVYTITNQRLRIKRGILSKRIQQTRIDRVQNVNTEQSVLDRILRVGTVDFDTAGTDDSDFTFAGVSSPSRVVEAVDRAQHAAAGGRAPSRSSSARRAPQVGHDQRHDRDQVDLAGSISATANARGTPPSGVRSPYPTVMRVTKLK